MVGTRQAAQALSGVLSAGRIPAPSGGLDPTLLKELGCWGGAVLREFHCSLVLAKGENTHRDKAKNNFPKTWSSNNTEPDPA